MVYVFLIGEKHETLDGVFLFHGGIWHVFMFIIPSDVIGIIIILILLLIGYNLFCCK